MSYELRELKLENDRSFLVEILEKNLLFSNGANGVLNWNDSAVRYSSECMIIEHKVDDHTYEKIGNICTYYRNFCFFKKKFKAGVFGNLVIDEKHRSLQPALILVKGNTNKSIEKSSFLYVFPNKKAIGLFKLAGFKSVGKLTRYSYLNSYSYYMSEHIPFVGSVIGTVIDRFRYALISVQCSINNRKYTTIIENSFPEFYEDFFKKSFLSQFICSYRDAEYMKWRYIDNPEHDYQIMNCYEECNNETKLISSCVFTVVENILSISDMVFIDKKGFKIITLSLKKWALKRHLRSISIRYMGSDIFKNMLISNGFHERESDWDFVTKSADAKILSTLIDPNNWYILDGDEDI